jgi:hypothetical protein
MREFFQIRSTRINSSPVVTMTPDAMIFRALPGGPPMTSGTPRRTHLPLTARPGPVSLSSISNDWIQAMGRESMPASSQ